MVQQAVDPKWASAIKAFIGSSPPCQLNDVVTSCRRLSATALPEDLFEESCVDHNERTALVVTLPPSNESAVLCISGRHSTGGATKAVTYREAGPSGRIFTVDQEHQVCETADGNPDQASAGIMLGPSDLRSDAFPPRQQPAFIEHFRSAVDRDLGTYVAEHYPPRDGLAAKAVYTTEAQHAKGFALHIVIASRRSRKRGHWAGSWRSEWRTDFTPGDAVATLIGELEFTVHYSEAGNMHFSKRTTKHADIRQTSDASKFAQCLVDAIADLEEEFHVSTNDACVSFGAIKLKAMRRMLPVSKERFDWRPVRHALARDMRGGIEMTKQPADEEVDF